MKKVALFMMVLALAVSLAACQGAVGPQGDQGPKGDTGDPGTPGTPGTEGIDAFEVISDDDHTVLFNVQEEVKTVDVSMFFRGGAGVTYKSSTETLDDFKVAISGSSLSLTPTKSGNELPDPADATATDGPFSASVKTDALTEARTQSLVVTATDADDVERTKTVLVQYNRAPRVDDTLTEFTPGDPGFATISIGTQRDVIMDVTSADDDTLKATPRAWGDGPDDTNLVTCKTYNECDIMLETFYDDDDDDDTANMQGVRTYAAVSSDSAVSVTPIKGGLRLTVNGLQAKVADVTIDEITATDANGLTFKDSRTITVKVDPRPTDPSVQYSLEAARGSTAETPLIPALGAFFENKDGADVDQALTYNLAKDVPSPLVTVAIADGAAAATVTVSAVASKGNYQFTVRAREAGYRGATHTSDEVGQWVEKEFTLSVTDPATE